MKLHGRRVLVTRPAGQSALLVAELNAQGAHPFELPLLQIQTLDNEKDAEALQHARQIVQQLDQYSKIIFISTNAVRSGLPILENYWPQWPLGLQWIGIGVATQHALQDADIIPLELFTTDNALQHAMTTEALLTLPIFAQLQQQHILIVQGEGGRGVLAEQLQQRGARVDTLVCYRRVTPPALLSQWLALDQATIDAVLISSAEALHNLLQLPDVDSCKSCVMIAPSERVVALAQQAGFLRCYAASNASDAAMLQALNKVFNSVGQASA